jgi:PIN domain nuclease of toxin-antitoxin system
MKLLLDTHVFLWLMTEPERLSAGASAACREAANELYLSVVSLWEIQIKAQLGKLKLHLPLSQIVQEQSKLRAVS